MPTSENKLKVTKHYFAKIRLSLFITLGLALLFFVFYQSPHQSRSLASVKKKTILIGVDGLSRENFDYAQNQLGLFKMFKNVSTHMAPFPSISDYSWNILMHSREVFGKRGRIKNYEAAHYNYRNNILVEDPREYFRRIGSDSLYFEGFFDYYLNPYVEALLYFPTEELPRQELKQIKESLLKDSGKAVDTVMIASVDALSHTRPSVFNYLKEFDTFLNEVKAAYDEQHIELEIILVSDHGQASRYTPATEPVPLLPADFNIPIKRAGLNKGKTLLNDNDVVLPIMALGNYAVINLKNLKNREKLVDELRKEVWFEQAVFVESGDENLKTVAVYNHDGKAKLEIRKENDEYQYRYTMISGNPLQLPSNALGIFLTDREAQKFTNVKTPYPDSLFRIAQTVWQEEADMPDMLVTIVDQYRIKGDLDKYTTMFNTHGSLSKRSSLGIVATTNSEFQLPATVRTKDILSVLKMNPLDLAKNKNKGFNSDTKNTYNLLNLSGYDGIATESADYTNQRIFGLINKTVHYSNYVLDTVSLGSLTDFIKPLVGQLSDSSSGDGAKLDGTSFNTSNIDLMSTVTPEDFALMTDLILKYGDIEKIKLDPRFIKLKEKISSKFKLSHNNKMDTSANPSGIQSINDLATKATPYTINTKRAVMKSYGTTFLLENALNIPEFEKMKDDRDNAFRLQWSESRDEYILSPHSIKKSPDIAQKLFSEIFQERRIAYDIFPTQLPLLYNRLKQSPENITVVYVPGIYNSIFDNEIFQMGLDAISNNLGVRVIAPPVLSACSSKYNADIILKTLKDDIIFNQERGRAQQKYFFIGYSKGGMDTLYAFNKEPAFIKEKVLGLLTMASPLAGTSILNKTDLPITLLEMLSEENIPEVCRKDEKASSSLTPVQAQMFMSKNAATLVGLTRYYSLSFKSEVKNSHIFMKATKAIAKFDEPNDGVVTLSSSHFPEVYQAVDLGVVEGDHLSGIIASHFPQEAFMEAAYLTLLELDGLDFVKNQDYNKIIKYDSPIAQSSDHMREINGLIDANDLDKTIKNVKKGMSAQEKLKVTQEIKEKIILAVKGSTYDVKDFNVVVAKDGKIQLVFAKPLADQRFYLFWRSNKKITVSNAEDIIKVLLGNLQKSDRNLLADGVELWRTYPISDRPTLKLPNNELAYIEDFRIDLQNLDKFIKGKHVVPMTQASYPKGFNIVYDHRRAVDFRKEYQFNYESTAPMNPDDNSQSGWASILNSDNNLEAKLSSNNSSIRLTSYAMRFMPKDFSHIEFNLQVNKSIPGSNNLIGGSGKDDSAFQVWFTIREVNSSINREILSSSEKMLLFGYYFSDELPSTNIQVGQVYQNYYSNKNFLIVTLPEAKQIPIGVAPGDLKKRIISSFDLRGDLKRSFPDIDVDKMEIVGITIQHDSNDMKGSSEALFKSINFLP